MLPVKLHEGDVELLADIQRCDVTSAAEMHIPGFGYQVCPVTGMCLPECYIFLFAIEKECCIKTTDVCLLYTSDAADEVSPV